MRTLVLAALMLGVGCAPSAAQLAARQAQRMEQERKTAELVAAREERDAAERRATINAIMLAAVDQCTAYLPSDASDERRNACFRAESRRMVDAEIARIERRTDAEIAARLAVRQTAALEESARQQEAMRWSIAFGEIARQLNPPPPAVVIQPVYVAPQPGPIVLPPPAPSPLNCTSYVAGSYINTNCR